MQYVVFECVAEGSKLRVRIASPGYFRSANCQFPRDIRAAGRRFTAPPDAVSLVQGPRGKYFYRVNKSLIAVAAGSGVAAAPAPLHVFGDDEPTCVVCLEEPKTLVFAPCGHFCCCDGCFRGLSAAAPAVCPMCRARVGAAVPRDQVE